MASLLAQGGVTHGHKPGAATANNSYPLTLFRELVKDAWGEFCGLAPDLWLGVDFTIGM
jgi:hypothetical protein